LVNLLTSEAELASVLGHEIGHVTARHSVSQLSRAQLAQLGLGLGMVLVPELRSFNGLATTGLSLLFLKYGRDAERQADELGFRYAFEQNYDINEMADVFAALQRSSSLAGRSAVPGWLATHPAESERIATARDRVASLAAQQQDPRTGREEYLRRIDGSVFGADPRQGFFRDETFYHPELRFQFTSPEGWKTQNLSTAVVAMSPQQDGAVQLTLAGESSVEEAARRFAASQNVRVGQATRQRFAQVPGLVTEFAAQTEQTVVRGYAAFFNHGGRVYQMLTFAPQNAFAAHDDAFQRTISSFAPVEDRSILSTGPQRIDVVRLDRSMSLEEFARRHDSAIDLDQLALINHIEDPDAPIPAGTSLKTVRRG
jgi:predicted Zn-dependent protease